MIKLHYDYERHEVVTLRHSIYHWIGNIILAGSGIVALLIAFR